MEQINRDNQLSYPQDLRSTDIFKSIVDFTIITIPATIGNNVFINSGLNNKTIPSNNSTIPRVKKLNTNKLFSFSIIKYTPFTIKAIAKT